MPENTVRKLHDEPVVKVIATGVSVVVGLANDRQMTFQSGFEGDELDGVVNERLDRLMRIADRLKARYEIPTLEDELELHERQYAQFLQDFTDVERRHEVEQAQRQVQLDVIRRDATAKWEAGNHRGNFQPQGATKVSLDNIQSAFDKAENERAQYLKSHGISKQRFEEETALRVAKLAKAKALAEG